MELARNVELKARLHDLAAAQQIAKRLATAYLGVQQQVDTYFHSPHGRLKLREISTDATAGSSSSASSSTAQLVWYSRPDQAGAKGSDYLLVDVPDPARLKQALAAALGVQVIVDKRREIFLHHNVRIHLDEVTNLGAFLEFEAVLSPSIADATGHAQVAALQSEFGITSSDILAVSYSDLLLSLDKPAAPSVPTATPV
jgi:predicted adenylyl cyclase CyaB